MWEVRRNKGLNNIVQVFSLSYWVDMILFIKRDIKEGQVEGVDEFNVRYIEFELFIGYFK